MIRAKFGRNTFDPVLITGNNDDFCAFGGVRLGAVAPDAARAAGEKNNFIFEQ